MKEYHQPRLSRFTHISIEAGYLLGAPLGALSCLSIWNAGVLSDYWIGGGLLLIALLIQVTCYKAIMLTYPDYFYKLGQGLSTLIGLVFLILSAWPLQIRGPLAIAFLGLAYCLYKGMSWAGKLWNGITLLLLALAFFLYILSFSIMPSQSHILILYFSLNLFLMYGIRFWKSRAKAKLSVSGPDNLQDLWNRGRLFEIFKLSQDFTKLNLAENYSAREQEFPNCSDIKTILDSAYTILLVNETRALYRKSRQVMDNIRKQVGDKKFFKAESKIWQELWAEIQLKYPLQPNLLTSREKDRLTDNYARRIQPRK